MKKFILGFVVALVLCGIVIGAYMLDSRNVTNREVLKENNELINQNEEGYKEEIDKADNTNTKNEESKKDYSKYIGTWTDEYGMDEFTVKYIGNDLITFTWFIYRIEVIDNITVPIEDNKAVFYYHGYNDRNFNSKNEDDEFYCRKATVELKENIISIKVEDVPYEYSLDKLFLADVGVYIKPGEYIFLTKYKN